MGARVGVLDFGCGNGVPAARWLVEPGCAVTGVDGSGELIDRARVLVAARRLTG